jgi:NADH:ubiquinone oxidoreductase subunit 6 (subunit J)
MTTTSNNFLESILMLALVVLIAALVFHLAGAELSAVANKVAESFQKASY